MYLLQLHTFLSFPLFFLFFFFNDTATTEIYTLSLHDALPISSAASGRACSAAGTTTRTKLQRRSEEHTSELQSLTNLVCRLLLEKKKKQHTEEGRTTTKRVTKDTRPSPSQT